MEHSFSIHTALRWGWQTLKVRSALLYQVLFTSIIVQIVYAIVGRYEAGTAAGIATMVVLYIANFIIEIGLLFITLKLAREEDASYRDIVPPGRILIKYILATILLLLLMGIPFAIALIAWIIAAMVYGLAFTIVAALIAFCMVAVCMYLALRYAFIGFSIFDGLSISNSFRQSAQLTRGHKWHLLGFMLIFLLLNILGAIVFVVGLLVSVPVTMLAMAHIYLQLKGAAPRVEEEE